VHISSAQLCNFGLVAEDACPVFAAAMQASTYSRQPAFTVCADKQDGRGSVDWDREWSRWVPPQFQSRKSFFKCHYGTIL
jgi:hypothetical protein